MVLLLGSDAPEVVTAAYAAGVSDVLVAPVRPAALADRVTFQLRSAQLGDETRVGVAQRLLGVEALAIGERDQREQALAEADRVELFFRAGHRPGMAGPLRPPLELRRSRKSGQRERNFGERICGPTRSRALGGHRKARC